MEMLKVARDTAIFGPHQFYVEGFDGGDGHYFSTEHDAKQAIELAYRVSAIDRREALQAVRETLNELDC